MTKIAVPGWRARLSARFDARLLKPPMPALASHASAGAGAQQLALTLQSLADRSLPFALGHFPLHPAAAQRERQLALLQHHLLDMDGTHHMQALGGRWRQGVYRLMLKLQESSGRMPQTDLPWDCGFVRRDPELMPLLSRFCPRRPTFMVTWQLPAADTAAVITSLQGQAPHYPHPVRLLICQAPQAHAWP